MDCAPSAPPAPSPPPAAPHTDSLRPEEQLSAGVREAPSRTEEAAPTEEEEEESEEAPPPPAPPAEPPHPVPKPRLSRQTTPSPRPSPPIAKPRSVLIINPPPAESFTSPPAVAPAPPAGGAAAGASSRPKQSLKKLQLTAEEKSQLVNLQSFSADSDSETPGGSSSCSSSSGAGATAGGGGAMKPAAAVAAGEGQGGEEEEEAQEEEGYWSGSTASHVRERRNRRCFKRKEMPSGQTRVRSKFSPWNLSSPRISRDGRLSVLVSAPGRVGKEGTRAAATHWLIEPLISY